jgi:hypothetical protein
MPLCNDIIKNREIRFKLSTPDQAQKAEQLLNDVAGIERIEAIAPDCLHIQYSVETLTLQMIESALRDVGFDLEDSIITRVKRAVYSYCEDALRASIGIDETTGGKPPDLKLSHQTLQDPRPHDWRKYV